MWERWSTARVWIACLLAADGAGPSSWAAKVGGGLAGVPWGVFLAPRMDQVAAILALTLVGGG